MFAQELDPDLAVDSIFGKKWGTSGVDSVINIPRPSDLPQPAPPSVVPYDHLSCYVLITETGNNGGSASWGVRAMLRCGSVEYLIPGLYYGPRIVAMVDVWGVGDSLDQLSFPKSWFKNYGITTKNIFLESNDSLGGDLTSLNLSDYPVGSIISYRSITNPSVLYSNGVIDWHNVEGSAHYETNDQTYDVRELITYANGNYNKSCLSAINDPLVSSIPVIGTLEFQYRSDAPFACGN